MVTVTNKTVKWLDAWSDYTKESKYTLEDIEDFGGYIRQTTGFCLLDNEHCIVLAMDYFPQHEIFRRIICIPKCCIIKDSD